MNKYALGVLLIRMKIDANEILIGNGKVKCFHYQKESLNKLNYSLMKMNNIIFKIIN